MLQYYMTIIAYTQQLLDMEDLFGTPANFINFYFKKLASGSWILAFECGLICLYGRWKCYGNFHFKTKLILLFN